MPRGGVRRRGWWSTAHAPAIALPFVLALLTCSFEKVSAQGERLECATIADAQSSVDTCKTECNYATSITDNTSSFWCPSHCICGDLATDGEPYREAVLPQERRCYNFQALDREQYLVVEVTPVSPDAHVVSYLRTGTGPEASARIPIDVAYDYKFPLLEEQSQPHKLFNLTRDAWRSSNARRDEGEWVGSWTLCVHGLANQHQAPIGFTIRIGLSMCPVGEEYGECSGRGRCVQKARRCPGLSQVSPNHICRTEECNCDLGYSGRSCEFATPSWTSPTPSSQSSPLSPLSPSPPLPPLPLSPPLPSPISPSFPLNPQLPTPPSTSLPLSPVLYELTSPPPSPLSPRPPPLPQQPTWASPPGVPLAPLPQALPIAGLIPMNSTSALPPGESGSPDSPSTPSMMPVVVDVDNVTSSLETEEDSDWNRFLEANSNMHELNATETGHLNVLDSDNIDEKGTERRMVTGAMAVLTFGIALVVVFVYTNQLWTFYWQGYPEIPGKGKKGKAKGCQLIESKSPRYKHLEDNIV